MDPRFTEIENRPENQIFSIVFYPDRIYHAQYLNATRSPRYRYYVHEVRNKVDNAVLKGQVFLDGALLARFIRIEYRASRLVELAREKERFLKDRVLAFIKVNHEDPAKNAEGMVRLHYDAWIGAFQAEIWDNLEPPPTKHHDAKVESMMGRDGSITRIRRFGPALSDPNGIRQVEVAFRENEIDIPFGYKIGDPQWDNNFKQTYQVPNTQTPSADQNTVPKNNYLLDFQRGFFFQNVRDLLPVRYKNAMTEPTSADFGRPGPNDNTIEMRWVVQRELGGSNVWFHEVTIPAGTVEGTHQHIGSEELYYIFEGEGIAYMGDGDDPRMSDDTKYPLRTVDLFGLPKHDVREVKVQPGSVIFTKSGGIHGIRNINSDKPLRFVAFGYHCA
ncbi:cupin domain-containing protein [Pedosphaera parvula]|uniref:Cupin 2 conserved barrel domain protein n=1 Tax=Pedosphaera parvula (strain Ellin514) TaxID=320771 RepID=B9XCV4_PEDPL|nr:cupin domain-containing protein [Pedosphaera parvula]EEF62300.1 Cupin 2 conserved barrel domain protein [Pedosphaera parvula Ellin514]